ELLSVGGKEQRTVVDDVEELGIAVVRRAQQKPARLLLTRDLDDMRAAHHRDAGKHALDRAGFDEPARGGVVEGGGGMRRRRARDLTPAVAARDRQSAIDDDPVVLAGELEGKTA